MVHFVFTHKPYETHMTLVVSSVHDVLVNLNLVIAYPRILSTDNFFSREFP